MALKTGQITLMLPVSSLTAQNLETTYQKYISAQFQKQVVNEGELNTLHPRLMTIYVLLTIFIF